jgi:hypothetical protein
MKNFLCIVVTSFFVLGATAQQPPPIRYYRGLEVHIAPTKVSYDQGETLTFRVEFHNEGPRSIRIGKSVVTGTEAPFRLSIKIIDSHGHLILDPLPDRAELPCVDLRERVPHDLVFWVDLDPGATFATNLIVASRSLQNANPGLYKIRGHYRSYGMIIGGHCIDFPGTHDDTLLNGTSTGAEWKGELDTNEVTIRIANSTRSPSY